MPTDKKDTKKKVLAMTKGISGLAKPGKNTKGAKSLKQQV